MSSSSVPLEGSVPRSSSRNRAPNSRPSTPLRSTSRSSLRDGHGFSGSGSGPTSSQHPLESFEPAFAELSDSMADLEANFMQLQLMHESLSRFSESFASFLYGLNMNAFCVDFPEAPVAESFKRARQEEEMRDRTPGSERYRQDLDGETTFLTTDTSFVENPPTSSRSAPKFSTPAPASRTTGSTGHGPSSGYGSNTRGPRGRGRGPRASGLARARGSNLR